MFSSQTGLWPVFVPTSGCPWHLQEWHWLSWIPNFSPLKGNRLAVIFRFHSWIIPAGWNSIHSTMNSLVLFQWVVGKWRCHFRRPSSPLKPVRVDFWCANRRHGQSGASSSNSLVLGAAICCKNLTVCVLHWCQWTERHREVHAATLSVVDWATFGVKFTAEIFVRAHREKFDKVRSRNKWELQLFQWKDEAKVAYYSLITSRCLCVRAPLDGYLIINTPPPKIWCHHDRFVIILGTCKKARRDSLLMEKTVITNG